MYNTYDATFKAAVVEEYLATKAGYRAIATKYGIPRDTVRDWVCKYKKAIQSCGETNLIPNSNFLEITDKIKHIPLQPVEKEELVTVFINGYSITADAKGIKAIIGALAQ